MVTFEDFKRLLLLGDTERLSEKRFSVKSARQTDTYTAEVISSFTKLFEKCKVLDTKTNENKAEIAKMKADIGRYDLSAKIFDEFIAELKQPSEFISQTQFLKILNKKENLLL